MKAFWCAARGATRRVLAVLAVGLAAVATVALAAVDKDQTYAQMLVLLGWAVWLGNAAPFGVLPLSVLLLNQLQIRPEERILRERFGEHYTRYAGRVRRWV